MKRFNQPALTIFLLTVASLGALYSQPYYYYLRPLDSKGRINEIRKINMSNTTDDLFLTDSGSIRDISWNQDQSWLYVSTKYDFQIIETATRHRRILISNASYRGSDGAIFIPQLNRLYVSWLRPYGDQGSTVSQTHVFDASSFALIDSNGPGVRPSSIISEDGTKYFDYGPDSSGNYTVFCASLTSELIIQEKPFAEVGPPTDIKLLIDGKRGKGLMDYAYQSGHQNGRFCILDLATNRIEVDFPFPWRSEAQLSPDGKFIIIEEVYFEKSPSEPDEYRPGSVFIFEASTGKLTRKLALPPQGKILFFDNYPDKFFYLIENTSSVPPISANLSEVIPTALLLDTLISLKHLVYAANQLGDANFVKELDNGLENAKKHLANGDSANCSKELGVFQGKVKAEYEKKSTPGSKRFVTEEAYKQLYFNAQYIIDRLPKK